MLRLPRSGCLLIPRHPTLFSTVAPCGSRRRAPPCCCFRASPTRTRAPCCSNARLVHPCPRHAHPALAHALPSPDSHTCACSLPLSLQGARCALEQRHLKQIQVLDAFNLSLSSGSRPLLRLAASPPTRGLSSDPRPLLRPARRDAVHTTAALSWVGVLLLTCGVCMTRGMRTGATMCHIVGFIVES